MTSWIFIFIASYVFKFCLWYRMLLYYILIINGLNTLDYYVGIPLSDFNLLILYLLIASITLFTILYIHVKHHKKLIKQSN